MSNKKYLIKRLLEYPEITTNEYISLIDKKNKITLGNNNFYNDDINKINDRIELYNEKQMIINLIKNPFIQRTYNSNATESLIPAVVAPELKSPADLSLNPIPATT